ncbi:tetratricopeptide repeat protein 7B [Ischnura elegans]|uniref:tetratricopeptide repeat protein 7B n=1 Tax=Ischnura elegans TaxID=197161 RepID=UPI001ED89726|nr:tetratricopeptide repeat protein 7B [Ischnura elegans]
MAGKGRNIGRYEADIEKCREEGNWKREVELAEQMKTRLQNDALATFCIGEGKLESFLEEFPPVEQNISRARNGLNDAKRYLMLVVTEDVKKEMVLDAHLLLGKLHYAMGWYDKSLTHYQQADLHTLPEQQLPSRSLRIVAESFAIKGLCLEKVPPPSTSKFRMVEWEEQMVRCFELAGDLTLLYLQEQDKVVHGVAVGGPTGGGVTSSGAGAGVGGGGGGSSGGAASAPPSAASGGGSPQPPLHPERHLGPILEMALQRAPILYIRQGKLQSAVNRYRTMLSAVESSATQNLRLTLTRQLAEVLLRGVSGNVYAVPSFVPSSGGSMQRVRGVRGGGGSESPWKPRKYMGLNQFVPRSENEEIILLLLISEAMAVRDAVLSQSPEFRDARVHAYDNTTAVYDLLAITLVRWGLAHLLNESFERALKFSFEEPHVWMQRALCLMASGRHALALPVLSQVARQLPNATLPCLLAARLCYEHLNRVSEGVEWSRRAIGREQGSPSGLMARCQLHLGIGLHLMALASQLKKERRALASQAIDCFRRAEQSDAGDHLPQHYLALCLATFHGGLAEAGASCLAEAGQRVRLALSLRAEHHASLQLLALLLSAEGAHDEALELVNASLEKYPSSLNLLYVRAALEAFTGRHEVAIMTAKEMLLLWRTLYKDDGDEGSGGGRSVFQLYSTTADISDKDSSSLHAHSLAASRVEQALSEVASSFSSQPGGQMGMGPTTGPSQFECHHRVSLQLRIWLLIADLFLALDYPAPAESCVREAATISPMSHQVMHARGLIHEHRREFSEAKRFFQNAVAINPIHVESLQHLGLMYHYLGSHRLAEKTLRDATKIDPTSHQTWYNLGKVLEAMGEYESASNCMITALEVETTSPVLPYATVPITFE